MLKKAKVLKKEILYVQCHLHGVVPAMRIYDSAMK